MSDDPYRPAVTMHPSAGDSTGRLEQLAAVGVIPEVEDFIRRRALRVGGPPEILKPTTSTHRERSVRWSAPASPDDAASVR